MSRSYDPSVNLRTVRRHAYPRVSWALVAALLAAASTLPSAAALAQAPGTPNLPQTPPSVTASGGAISCSSGSATVTCSTQGNSSTQATVVVNNQANPLGDSIGGSPYNLYWYSSPATMNGTVGSGTFNAGSGTYAIGYFGNGAAHNWVNSTDSSSETDNNQATSYDSTPMAYVIGPTITLTNNTTINMGNFQATGNTGVLDVISTGANGTIYGGHNLSFSSGTSAGQTGEGPGNTSPYDGGAGGAVTVNNYGPITATGTSTSAGGMLTPIFAGVGAYSFGGNGSAWNTDNSCCLGAGGNGGPVTVNTYFKGPIKLTTTTSTPAAGIEAISMGGVAAGYDSSILSEVDTNGNYKGGSGGNVSVSNNSFMTVSASKAYGILAESFGAVSPQVNGNYMPPGNGGTVTVENQSNSSITLAAPFGTTGSGIGIVAASLAGANNDQYSTPTAGNVTVTLDQGSTIYLNGGGGLSIGALAVSGGATSILRPFDPASQVSNSGIGQSGAVEVTNNGIISTTGRVSAGIAALSIGGAAAVTTASGSSTLGNSGGYYAATPGSVTVSNGGSIQTEGVSAFGIVAMSTSNGGGLVDADSSASRLIVGGADGGAGQCSNPAGQCNNAGTVIVTNTGSITTGNGSGGGNAAIGIVAQSIGGGGGSASGSYIVGGQDGNSGGGGGAVTVNVSSGNLMTFDTDAIGILAQSIGGGGGNGGDATGIIYTVGGAGSDGGSGGAVTVNIGASNVATVSTGGDFAAGVVAQSVGGGGGNGGAAESFGTTFTAAIGGSGGGGSNGGTVDVTNAAKGMISTIGESAHGVIAQSVGGGGGNGGAANAYTANVVFSASMAVGGTGGAGGGGNDVAVTNQGLIYTGQSSAPSAGTCSSLSSACALQNLAANASGFDSIGILAQSIGGGGGNGGSALAKSLAIGGDPEIPTISASFALGGSGSGGGNGDTVTVGNAGNMITYGNGSQGIVAQSIGGGGGNGGDSSATAASIEGKGVTANVSVSLGGSGGAAGNGATVQVTNGGTASLGSITDCTSGCAGSITTSGNYATGILAQSIGGGGGNGGLGDATANSPNLGSTLSGADTGKSLNLSIGVGGSGGSGSSAGSVTVYNDLGSSIISKGSGAQGILAQSIGGGGGNAGGGDTTGGGNTVNLDVTVGGTGGSGNNGGIVTVANAGTIKTQGGDGVGIMAQSIGAGGGNGGGTDNAASLDWQGIIENLANPPTDNSYKANVSVGGSGGASGAGSTVNVTNTGTVATVGERAYGILAQSIGGGGGSGGSAATDASDTFSFGISVGGSGSGGGGGGNVTVTSSGSITTTGFNAYGIAAQSIGGGGGIGADGTTGGSATISDKGILPTMTVGANYTGSSGTGGNGLNVVVDSTNGSISTTGDDAYGILAQSIGGGGGAASAGGTSPGSSSKTPSVPAMETLNLGGNGGAGGWGAPVTVTGNTITTFGDDAYGILAQSIGGGGGVGVAASGGSVGLGTAGIESYQVGGSSGASGSANTVTVTQNGALVTSGARSFGIVAQSIGGGGGIATNANANLASTQLQFNAGQNYAKGGAVNVNLNASGSITTSGAGAWGILAQSIGGGGGFVGDPSLNLSGPVSNTLADLPNSNSDYPDSGTVTVNVAGNITTTGANAHGVFAQAVGGGGGIAAGCSGCTPTAYVVAGDSQQIYSSLTAPTYAGEGMNVTVTQSAGSTILTKGPGSIGIVAQSTGKNDYQQPITVTIGGTVTGGTMTGYSGTGVGAAGILLSGGGAGTVAPNNNTITVNAGGSVSTVDGISGTAITTSYGYANVVNSGTITGNIELNPFTSTYTNNAIPAGTILNNAGGVLNTGPTIIASSLTNSGTLNVGGTQAVGTTNLTGNYTQTSGGVLGVTINSLASSQQASMLTVSGTAQLSGQIVPSATNLLPGTYNVLTAGSLTSTATPTTAPLLFNWSLVNTATSVSLSPTANFTPAGATLTPSQASLASYYQNAWNNSDKSFAGLFATLNGVTSSNKAQFISQLNDVSGKSTAAQSTALQASSATMLEAPLSCPVFVGQGTQLGEDSCVWARMSGWLNSQSNPADSAGYKASGSTYRIGGQHVIAQDWFLGGSLATGQDWTTMDGGSKGSGQTFDGSVALKHTMGPWLFAGSVALGDGAFQTNRLVSTPGLSALLNSNQNTVLVGGRLRAAYEFPLEDWYVRPYTDLDVTHLSTGSFQESGNSPFALSVRGSDHTGVALTPMVEVGLRRTLADGIILRPYVAAGFSYMPNNSRKISASFMTAQPGDGTFTDVVGSSNLQGNVAVGLQLYRAGGFEVRAEYALKAGFQTASARLAYHF